ncbi:MAG: NAD(P)H-dependent oxidoreductase [Gemmatimonadota bacterium]|nr:NAD(P)H-dependent oxidoreductase [Gemmatimonadota bacterium]
MTRILALSGSLRALSSNTSVLRVAARVAPRDIDVQLHPGLDVLPFFNPDLDRDLDDPALPATVRSLRQDIANADAILISSPEYAHGVSGLMKNALDWLVGGTEMVGRAVAVINTSPHAFLAYDALLETLRTMSAELVDGACLAIDVPRNQSLDALATNPTVTTPLREALRAIRASAIRP